MIGQHLLGPQSPIARMRTRFSSCDVLVVSGIYNSATSQNTLIAPFGLVSFANSS